MDFTVEHDVYTFKYNKIIQGIDGKDVVITEHIENVTLKELFAYTTTECDPTPG